MNYAHRQKPVEEICARSFLYRVYIAADHPDGHPGDHPQLALLMLRDYGITRVIGCNVTWYKTFMNGHRFLHLNGDKQTQQ